MRRRSIACSLALLLGSAGCASDVTYVLAYRGYRPGMLAEINLVAEAVRREAADDAGVHDAPDGGVTRR